MNIETLQIVIIAALSVSTILVTIIGIQLIFLLREARVIVKRVRNLSNGLNNIASIVERSIHDVASLTDGAKIMSAIFGKLLGRNKNNE